jgi:hypothetical protein
MDLLAGEGEPDIRERPFEELPGLEAFNAYYIRNGGQVTCISWVGLMVGRGTRWFTLSPDVRGANDVSEWTEPGGRN